MDPYPIISIIIPTHNRAHLLPLNLDSFLAQDYPKDRYEIIVADNNSTDTTKDEVSRYIGFSSVPVKYMFEQRQGVHYARNSAAKLANGDILYFTDDDMIADVYLLKEIIKPFAIDGKVAVATGKVLPKWEEPPPEWILMLCNNGLLSLMNRPEDLVISSINCDVFSCHQAIRRDVFFQSGGFNPENTAGEWIGDGETGLNLKIAALGYKFAFIGTSIIYHMIPSSRMTQGYLNQRLGNQGNCDSYTDYRKFRYDKSFLNRIIIRHYIELLKTLFSLLRNMILGKTEWRLNRARLSYYLHRIRYDRRLSSDENWRNLVLKDDWLRE